MNNIYEEAKRDARRYVEAKMNYGKGAGTKRKLLDAELSKKLQNPAYKTAFEAALSVIDQSKVVKKVKTKKSVQHAAETARKGYYAARRAGNFYSRNKYWIDEILRYFFK